MNAACLLLYLPPAIHHTLAKNSVSTKGALSGGTLNDVADEGLHLHCAVIQQ